MPAHQEVSGTPKVGLGAVKAPPARAELLDLYYRMLLIRMFELKMIELFADRMKRGDFPGALHSSEGQEAIAVGVCSALEKGDYVFSTYRGHGHALARGLDLNRVVAELNGKATGVSRGYGGSMHLFAPELNFMGGNGIVAGGLPMALGTACASAYRGDGRVTVTFFDDGGASQGSFHESVNMAALLKWPVLFICENNHYAATTHVSMNCPIENIADRSAAYGIPGVVVDGNDLFAVMEATLTAAARARRGEGPSLIECKTYRDRAHCMVIPEHRPSKERDIWKQNDPIARMRDRLLHEEDISPADLDAERAKAEESLAAALRFMEESSHPDPATMETCMWA